MLLFFWVSWLTAIMVAVMPVLYFLAYGWAAREAEFLDKIRRADRHADGPAVAFCALGCAMPATDAAALRPRPSDSKLSGDEIREYFDKFWSRGQAAYLARHPDVAGLLGGTLPPTYWGRLQQTGSTAAHAPHEARQHAYREMFRSRYRELIARRRYVWPLLLLIVVVATLSGLVVVTELRSGYEQFVAYFAGEAELDDAAIKAGVTILHRLSIDRMALDTLNRAVLPFPPLHLSQVSLGSITGAYLFVLTQLIQQCRARTLVYSDLFSASLRLLIAVPLGLAIATLAPKASAAPFIAFALGAFPIREFTAIVRRLAGRMLQFRTRAEEDDTLAMLGVTRSVSDVLAEENITCAQQLADIDPVVLAVRTGLSFDYVLFLAAQSLVWCFLGKTAELLGPLGYSDARAIWYLMRHPHCRLASDTRAAVFDALACQLRAVPPVPAKGHAPDVRCTDKVLLRQVFEKIAQDPYTVFLVHFTSDMDRPGVHCVPGVQWVNVTATCSAPVNDTVTLPPAGQAVLPAHEPHVTS